MVRRRIKEGLAGSPVMRQQSKKNDKPQPEQAVMAARNLLVFLNSITEDPRDLKKSPAGQIEKVMAGELRSDVLLSLRLYEKQEGLDLGTLRIDSEREMIVGPCTGIVSVVQRGFAASTLMHERESSLETLG